MEVRTIDDPAAFRATAGPFLRAEAARNNLILGIVDTLIVRPETHPSHRLWVAEADREVVGAALRTDPLNVVLADPADERAVDHLCDAIAGAVPDAPGVVANLPWAPRFAERWSARTGASVEPVLAQGVYELTRVRHPRPARGEPRVAGRADRELLAGWMLAFEAEALRHRAPDPVLLDRVLDLRLEGGDHAGMWLWEVDGSPVAVAGYSSAGESGTRIGPVYTPPQHRRRGYASNLVAGLSRWALEHRTPACYLYTDLANPTSNAIYANVGYRLVAESAEIRFAR